jgi:hypothetical protein
MLNVPDFLLVLQIKTTGKYHLAKTVSKRKI